MKIKIEKKNKSKATMKSETAKKIIVDGMKPTAGVYVVKDAAVEAEIKKLD